MTKAEVRWQLLTCRALLTILKSVLLLWLAYPTMFWGTHAKLGHLYRKQWTIVLALCLGRSSDDTSMENPILPWTQFNNFWQTVTLVWQKLVNSRNEVWNSIYHLSDKDSNWNIIMHNEYFLKSYFYLKHLGMVYKWFPMFYPFTLTFIHKPDDVHFSFQNCWNIDSVSVGQSKDLKTIVPALCLNTACQWTAQEIAVTNGKQSSVHFLDIWRFANTMTTW